MATTNEAFARVKIDALLAAQGWNIQDANAVRFEVAMPDGKRADYVLCDRHGRSLAVIEAKRFSINPGEAAEQAKNYAQQLGVPYIFLSNGAEVQFWEWEREAFPHAVKTIFKQDDLERRAASRQVRRDPLTIPIDRRIVERDYQVACIDTLAQEIVNGRRKLLVEMATGTGKTRTAAAFIKRLFEANACTRVLFLVDRIPLTEALDNERREQLGLPAEGYHVVLANPPFSGRVDRDRILEDVKVGTTTATELLFLKYMLDSLRPGGRCGVIVPEGVLFGSTGAHKELRRILVENNRVEAVMSLPGGVFQPYSGVKTSVVFFRKGGSTESVLFLHADNDGYKLDANHDQPIEADDFPALKAAYANRDQLASKWDARDKAAEWTEKWWMADTSTLRGNDFNLSASRYRPMSTAQVEHRDPRELLDELAAIEAEIVEEIEALKLALAEQPA